jgi:hypothetical protein
MKKLNINIVTLITSNMDAWEENSTNKNYTLNRNLCDNPTEQRTRIERGRLFLPGSSMGVL